MIREQSTWQSKAVIALNAQRRWAVTGTPVQSKKCCLNFTTRIIGLHFVFVDRLDDLAALIKFLRVKPFDEKSFFNQYIAVPFKVCFTCVLFELTGLIRSVLRPPIRSVFHVSVF